MARITISITKGPDTFILRYPVELAKEATIALSQMALDNSNSLDMIDAMGISDAMGRLEAKVLCRGLLW